MTVKEYFSTAYHSDADAQIIGEELERLNREQHATADDILAAATPKNSPLHGYFEWDNTKAARQHRLHQARNLARTIHIRLRDERTGETTEVRAFFAVRQTGDADKALRTYLTIDRVQADPALRVQVVAQAKTQLVSWRKRYSEYEEIFASVFEAIDQLTIEAETRIAA